MRDQLGSAVDRIERAAGHLGADDGSRALQEAYPAVVGAATIRVWLDAPPWEQAIQPGEMHRRIREEFPDLFAALSELDVQQALTSPWRATDAEPYVREARVFVSETQRRAQAWLEPR
jgi:hypothetical protein